MKSALCGTRTKLWCEIAVMIAISLLVVYLFSYVPMNADSYVIYTNLAWWHYPLNKLEWQSALFDLAPFGGHYLPLRADTYIGSINSLIYYPMFLIWPSPHSVRLLQLIALGIQAFLICRLTKYDMLKCFLILIAFMPYSFSHIIDVSVTGYQITGIYILIYLIAQWSQSFRKDTRWCWMYPMCIGFILFLGIWAKLQFVSFWPVVAIFVLNAAIKNRDVLAIRCRRAQFIRHCIIMAAIAGLLTGILLNAWCGSGVSSKIRYYEWGPRFIKIALEEGNFEYSPLPHLVGKLKYLMNPLQSAEFIYPTGVRVTVSGVALLAVTATLLVYGTVRLRMSGMGNGFILANACAIGVLTIIISCHPGMGAMRHVIMVYPFILLAMFHIRARLPGDRTITLLLSAFVVLNVYQYYKLTKMDYHTWEQMHPPGYGLVPKFTQLQKALDPYSGKYVYVHVDWGTYYIKALYGNRDQCNLNPWPLDSVETVKDIRRIGRRTGRKAMFVRMKDRSGNSLSFLKEHFPSIVRLPIHANVGWEVWYEPL